MDLKRFIEIVETGEYNVNEIKSFMDYLFNCNYNELGDYLLGDYGVKLSKFMHTLFYGINYSEYFYDWFTESRLTDNDVLKLFHKSNYLLYKTIEICHNGRIALVSYEYDEVYECKNYFDLLNMLESFTIFDDDGIIDTVIFEIKNQDFIDFNEVRLNYEK